MIRTIGPVEVEVRPVPGPSRHGDDHSENMIIARCGAVVLKTRSKVNDTFECTELLAQEAQRQAARQCCICGGAK